MTAFAPLSDQEFETESEFDRNCNRLSHLERPLTPGEVRYYLDLFVADREELLRFKRFNEETYQRNRILRTEFVDLLILCWRPGQRTPVHDHRGSTCGLVILEGTATEIGFCNSDVDLLIPKGVQTLNAGEVSVANDADIHLLGNFSATAGDLVSLHCYSPPLTSMKMYPCSNTFLGNDEEVTMKASSSGCYSIER